VPAISDYQLVSGALAPPSETDCFALGRRCLSATSMENSYNLPPLYALGDEGQGVTIAIIDSSGSPNMASDLNNFDTQMGLPHMCGEANSAQPCYVGALKIGLSVGAETPPARSTVTATRAS